MILKGFKFGMLLQLAVGPMCIMVFNTSTTYGFWSGFILTLSIALVDAIYITLSGLGVATVLGKEKIQSFIKLFGCVVLVVFGINILMSVFNLSLLPNITLFSNVTSKNLFVQGLILTASNPLTIIFWSGVLSTQAIENKLSKKQLFFFGIGCVLSTLCFLTVIALLGNVLSGFLPTIVMQVLNFTVGIVLIFFGIKLLLKNNFIK